MMRQLLSSQAFPYDSITSRIETGRPLPVFPLKGISGRIRVNTAVQDVRAMNVIGFIPGTDPNLKNEFVAIGAHFDHLGVDGDGQVYNGADDDGSGTVAVLEAARVLNALKQNRRSILVVFHGAEEKGLIGSEFLTDTTTENAFQMSQIVAQINVDMVGREHVDSLYVIGAGRLSSEMERLVVEVNREDSLFHFNYEFDREDDPNQFYSRSDHYNYARHRIPIVFFFDGMKEDYHKTSDDVEKIDFRKIEKVTRLITRLALRIANRDARLPVDRGHTSGTE
jgi:Zn-dependent M28 family amino/carboxypeptidase